MAVFLSNTGTYLTHRKKVILETKDSLCSKLTGFEGIARGSLHFSQVGRSNHETPHTIRNSSALG